VAWGFHVIGATAIVSIAHRIIKCQRKFSYLFIAELPADNKRQFEKINKPKLQCRDSREGTEIKKKAEKYDADCSNTAKI
jgi:hypothetical protein